MNDALHNRLMAAIRKVLRIEQDLQVPPKAPLQVSALPSFMQVSRGLENLPENSRTYLLPLPLDDETMLLGREDQFSQLDEALAHWQKGSHTSVVVVGPQGCGKTSLLKCFQQRSLKDQTVLISDMEERLESETHVLEFFCRLFKIDSVDNMEALIEQIMEVKPSVILLERAHNLLLRVIGGRRTVETFLYIILCTRQRHFWLITCRQFPWKNLERHVNISRYFSHTIDIAPLSEENLREALTLRLQKCGLALSFCRDAEDARNNTPCKPDEQNETADNFYKGIWSNSGGNFHAALYFMLLCCRFDTITQTLLVWPPDPLDMTFVKQIERFQQLTLAELICHGTLCAKEHAQIFRTLGLRSTITFEYLEQLNILMPVGSRHDGLEKTYDLSPVIHHAVTSELTQLNLLY